MKFPLYYLSLELGKVHLQTDLGLYRYLIGRDSSTDLLANIFNKLHMWFNYLISVINREYSKHVCKNYGLFIQNLVFHRFILWRKNTAKVIAVFLFINLYFCFLISNVFPFVAPAFVHHFLLSYNFYVLRLPILHYVLLKMIWLQIFQPLEI